MNLLTSELRYSTPFRIPKARMKVSRPILPILSLKLVAVATSLSDQQKRVKWVIYDQIHFGENRSGGSWDNLSKRFILKKETTGCTSLPILNFGVTGPKFTKIANIVARSSKINFLKNQDGDSVIVPGLQIQELIRKWDSERQRFTTTSYMKRPEPTPIKLSS